jgi:hypothetical protein
VRTLESNCQQYRLSLILIIMRVKSKFRENLIVLMLPSSNDSNRWKLCHLFQRLALGILKYIPHINFVNLPDYCQYLICFEELHKYQVNMQSFLQ